MKNRETAQITTPENPHKNWLPRNLRRLTRDALAISVLAIAAPNLIHSAPRQARICQIYHVDHLMNTFNSFQLQRGLPTDLFISDADPNDKKSPIVTINAEYTGMEIIGAPPDLDPDDQGLQIKATKNPIKLTIIQSPDYTGEEQYTVGVMNSGPGKAIIRTCSNFSGKEKPYSPPRK